MSGRWLDGGLQACVRACCTGQPWHGRARVARRSASRPERCWLNGGALLGRRGRDWVEGSRLDGEVLDRGSRLDGAVGAWMEEGPSRKGEA